MNRWKILLLLVLLVPNFGNSLKIGEEKMSVRRFKEIASYVGELISDYNEKNPEKTSDVAIMKFQKYRDSFFVDALIEKIPKENLILMPEMMKKVED
jgi:predicted HTH domain antitoxin